MAGYDPKRPRPSVSDDDALAPVDAILDATTGQVPVVVVEPAGGAAQESVPESEPVVAEEQGPAVPGPEPVVAEQSVPEPEPEPVVVSESAVGPESVPEPVVSHEPERHLRAVPGGASDVPIAGPPAEPTTNRAVLFVGAGGATLLAVLVLVALRRRRH